MPKDVLRGLIFRKNHESKQQKSNALRFVNQVRKALKREPILKLPLGIPQDSMRCSLALGVGNVSVEDGDMIFQYATQAYVVADALGYQDNPMDDGNNIVLPKEVNRFTKSFDDLKFPELVDIQTLLGNQIAW